MGGNNDAMMGTVTFKVPMDAPSQLHHHCLAHPNTDGIIDIREQGAARARFAPPGRGPLGHRPFLVHRVAVGSPDGEVVHAL